ncbi:MAG: hypothetical protein U0470_11195 [Anaerolineae bacterium]
MNGPDISPRSVRTALRQLAAERVPAEGPLVDLALVARMLERHGSPDTRPARQWALGQVLSETVETELERLRRRVDPTRAPLDPPPASPGGTIGQRSAGQPDDRHAAIESLRRDFRRDDAILEGCSAVYHLHLRPDLSLSASRLAALVGGRHARTVQRRLALGLALIAERLAALEAIAVAEDRRRRLLAGLPSPAGGRLFGVDSIVARIMAWLADPHGSPALALSGPGGCGKSTIAAAAARCAIERDATMRVGWIGAADRRSEAVAGASVGRAGPSAAGPSRGLGARTAGRGRHAAIERRVAESPPEAWPDHHRGLGSTAVAPLRALRSACAAVGARPGALIVVAGVDDAAGFAAISRRVAKGGGLPRLLITSRLCWGAVPSVETIPVPSLDSGAAAALLRHEGRRRGLPGVAAATDAALAAVTAAAARHPAALIAAAAELRTASMDEVARRFRMVPDARPRWSIACGATRGPRRRRPCGRRRRPWPTSSGAAPSPMRLPSRRRPASRPTPRSLCAALDLGLLAAADGLGAAFTTPPFLATWLAADRSGDGVDQPAASSSVERRRDGRARVGGAAKSGR